MKTIIRKWFWAWEFEEEERWLNQMAEKGQILCGVGFCKYIFEEGAPGEFLIRLEMLGDWPQSETSLDYIHFIEDTGAEHVGSVMRWVYFRKKAADGAFDLFSDIDSRVKHLDRLLKLFGILAPTEAYIGFYNLFLYRVGKGILFNRIAGTLCVFFALLLGYGFYIIWKRRTELKRERELHE